MNPINPARGLFGATAVCFLALAFSACDVLDRALNVQAPEQIPATDMEEAGRASLLVGGALADFDCAFGAYVVVSGLITDELIDAQALNNRWPYDRRNIVASDIRYGTMSCDQIGVYVPISTARYTTDNALRMLEEWTDAQVANRTTQIATMAAYAGYSHVLLGEAFCTAAIDLSAELPREEVFRRAEERFTRALAAAQTAGVDSLVNLARVGRARARLALGNHAAAAEDARQVPLQFQVRIPGSNTTTRQQNRPFVQNRLSNLVSVGPEYRQMTVDGVPDPRVRVDSLGRMGADGFTPLWGAAKYTSEASPIRLASGVEAQLIVAEAALQAGNHQEVVTIINALRQRSSLPTFASTDPTQIRNQLLEERRRELFLESHRFFDVHRHQIQLQPAPGTPYVKGGLYGNTTCLPLPNVERVNNPNIPNT
jgi:starch-binding outer membrane protein, SusD/RagB family